MQIEFRTRPHGRLPSPVSKNESGYLVYVDDDSQHGNGLPEPQTGTRRRKLITPKNAIYQTTKASAILRCLYALGSEQYTGPTLKTT